MLLLGFSDSWSQAQALAEALECSLEKVGVHRFPDRESMVQLPPNLPATVLVLHSLNHPNDKLIELMLTAGTARRLGVQRLILVAPYLCYMRQDREFVAGQSISQAIMGRFLADYFDALLTVDAHLHRVHDLHAAVPTDLAINLSAAATLGEFVSDTVDHPLLVGPDAESKQWVQAAAASNSLDYVVACKQRHGDRQVEIQLPDFDYAGRNAVLLDDMISTGHTLIRTAQLLQERAVSSVNAAVTHALHDHDTQQAMAAAGIRHTWSCDSVTHPSNCIPLASLLAAGLKQII